MADFIQFINSETLIMTEPIFSKAKLQKGGDFNIRNSKWGESRYMHLLWWKAQARRL